MMLVGKTIVLTAEDALAAASTATVQIIRKVAGDRKSDHGGTSLRSMRLRFADGIHGCMAEIALSRLMNVAWTAGGVAISRGDIGGTIEVRATEHGRGHLIVYSDDEDQSIFALMVGHYPTFRVAGFIPCWAAKRQEWWNERADPPSFWVPQSALEELDKIEMKAAA